MIPFLPLQLIGMTVFTFMCHHSIPSVIIPLADKRKTLKVVLVDYIIVLLYCGTMVFTAVINKPASQISPLYSLNFGDSSVGILANFLILYPVFTLSSNFPLICITLRNNLMELFPLSKVCWIIMITTTSVIMMTMIMYNKDNIIILGNIISS